MSTTRTRDSLLDAFDELFAALAGAGILTVALFPLALPLIALTTVVAIAFALMAVVAVGIVAVVAGPPVLVIRWLARPAGRAWLSRHETCCGIPIVVMLAVLAMPAGADGRARLFHFNACGSKSNHGTVDPVAGAIAASLVEFRPQAVSLNEMCRTQYRALLRRVRAAAASRRTAAARSTTCSSRPAIPRPRRRCDPQRHLRPPTPTGNRRTPPLTRRVSAGSRREARSLPGGSR